MKTRAHELWADAIRSEESRAGQAADILDDFPDADDPFAEHPALAPPYFRVDVLCYGAVEDETYCRYDAVESFAEALAAELSGELGGGQAFDDTPDLPKWEVYVLAEYNLEDGGETETVRLIHSLDPDRTV